jgi:starch phosphorylase
LTIGFARRFATYKRPNLLLRDPERLLRLLNHPLRPVQLVVAGKAHPDDKEGQALVREWVRFARSPEARSRAVFLSDHDMLMTERLVQGVDVWLNTPRRPWEACGTSGMKTLVNGGINLSELDGWWAEAYSPEVGWVFGDGREHDGDLAWDGGEAEVLFDVLEKDVVPAFYERDSNDVPIGWVSRIRESMAQLTPRFSANRTVREYTESRYLPAAAAFRARAQARGELGRRVAAQRRDLVRAWPSLRFGETKITTNDDHYGFETIVYFGDIDPDAVNVEVIADAIDGSDAVRLEMNPIGRSEDNGLVYRVFVPTSRPSSHYTPRVVSKPLDAGVPLEYRLILWQR